MVGNNIVLGEAAMEPDPPLVFRFRRNGGVAEASVSSRNRVERHMEALASIVESSDDAIVSKDLQGTIVSWNRGAERLFGYTADEAIGNPILMLIPTDRHHEETEILSRIRQGERVEHFDTVRRRKDGRMVHISLTVSPVKDRSGRIIGASKIARDITDRKEAEAALRESEQRLQLALDAGRMGVWEWDIASGHVLWSTSLQQIHDVDAMSFGGTFEDFQTDIHPDDRERVLALIQACLKARCQDYHVVYRTNRPEDEVRWLEGFGRVVTAADGSPIKMTGVCMDITDRKRAEQERELLVAELSHRVKNTLATVLSIARQTFDKGRSLEEARCAFGERIRALAQTHSRLAETNWAGVRLENMLEDELAPYRSQDGDNVRLHGPAIVLDPKSAVTLGMAVHELATNAAKYGALSAKTGRVDIRWDVSGGTAGGEKRFRMSWAEAGGPPVTPPSHRGFGRLLLERVLTADLQGKVQLDFAEHGVACTVDLPWERRIAPAA